MGDFFFAYDKFIIASLGWAYGYYLSHRSSRRAEVSRLKDRLVDRIEKVLTWYVDETSETSFSDLELEQVLADKISQCELRMRQFNSYVGAEIIDTAELAAIRNIDVIECKKAGFVSAYVYTEFADIIEHIECAYDQHYLKHNFLKRFWLENSDEIKGVILGGGALLVVYKLQELIL